MSQTQIFIIGVVTLFILFALYQVWKINRQKKAKEHLLKRAAVPDVLMGDDGQRKDPTLGNEPVEDSGLPSEEPPVYGILQEESEAKILDKDASLSPEYTGLDHAPVDPGVQWVLELVPQEGRTFSIGGIQSLWLELTQLNLPLQVSLWAQSRRDRLYYSPKHLPIEAIHVVVSVVMANRVAKLDAVAASKVLQAMEQAAAHNDVDVRLSADMDRVPVLAEQTQRFVMYFDTSVDLLIVPAVPEGAGFTLEAINTVAKEAGFKAASGRWEYRIDRFAREPLMTLNLTGNETRELRFTLDVPVANLARGDLKRFFSLANHLANHLGGVWLNAQKKPVETLGAAQLEQHLRERMKLMHQHGVDAGSERALRIFARGA